MSFATTRAFEPDFSESVTCVRVDYLTSYPIVWLARDGVRYPCVVAGIRGPNAQGRDKQQRILAKLCRNELRRMLTPATPSSIRVQCFGSDKYGRWLVRIAVDGVDVSDHFCKNSFAVSADTPTDQVDWTSMLRTVMKNQCG